MKTREKTWYKPLTLGKPKYETRETRPGEKALTKNDQKLLPPIIRHLLVHDYEKIATQLKMTPNKYWRWEVHLATNTDQIKRLYLRPKRRKGVSESEGRGVMEDCEYVSLICYVKIIHYTLFCKCTVMLLQYLKLTSIQCVSIGDYNSYNTK